MHWGPDQMAPVLQTMFLRVFPWMKILSICSYKSKLAISHHWFGSWLGAEQATSHCTNQWWPLSIHWRIYTSFGLDELTCIIPHSSCRALWSSKKYVREGRVCRCFLYRQRICTHQSYVLMALCEWNHTWRVNFPHKEPVMSKAFPLHNVIMYVYIFSEYTIHILQNILYMHYVGSNI